MEKISSRQVLRTIYPGKRQWSFPCHSPYHCRNGKNHHADRRHCPSGRHCTSPRLFRE